MTTPTAAPCVECGTTGGHIPRDSHRPIRRRGCCCNCYTRLWNHNAFTDKHQYLVRTPRIALCLSCGVESVAPTRDLCKACYARALGQGIVTRWPACGAVPVPYIDQTRPEHPDMPPPLTPAEFGRFLWHTHEGERQVCALGFRAEYDRLAVQAEAEAFAANWLSDHPAYAAKWCPPEAAAA